MDQLTSDNVSVRPQRKVCTWAEKNWQIFLVHCIWIRGHERELRLWKFPDLDWSEQEIRVWRRRSRKFSVWKSMNYFASLGHQTLHKCLMRDQEFTDVKETHRQCVYPFLWCSEQNLNGLIFVQSFESPALFRKAVQAAIYQL